MKHKVTIGKREALIVDLPDVIADGQIFEAQIGERRVQARWYRATGQLQFIEAGGIERNCNIRTRLTTAFDGDPSTSVTSELIVNSAKGLQCIDAQVTPYVPGQDQRRSAQSSQGLVVRSQITGKILKVLVHVGEHVEPGMGLVIIEAMKMENRVFAAAGGIIQSIAVQAGDQVAAGKEILRLAP